MSDVWVDLEEVKDFVKSEVFTNFLMDNTTNFTVAAYILQTLLNNIESDMEKIKNGD